MVVSSISMFDIFACIVNIHGFNLSCTNFHLSTGVSMTEKFKHQFEKLKTLSIYYTTLMVVVKILPELKWQDVPRAEDKSRFF